VSRPEAARVRRHRSPVAGVVTGVAALLAVLVPVGALVLPPAAVARPVRLLVDPWVAGSPTALALAAAPTEVPVGRHVRLTGRLTDPATGAGISGGAVRIEVLDPVSGTWSGAADLVADVDGVLTATVVPDRAVSYRLHHGEPGSGEESVSAPAVVRPTELTAALSTDAVRYGRSVRVAGVLVADPGSRLRLERGVGGRWQRVEETRTAGDQSYTFTVRPTSPGSWRWRVVRAAHGRAARLVAPLPRLDAFRLHTYSVSVRGAVQADVATFRAAVAETYADPRGWPRAHHRFREVPTGGAFTVVLARAAYLPSFAWFCSPAYSCQASRYVVINASRWAHGSRGFTGSLDAYRRYVVDHETGHWLGLAHARCPRRGALAPVMQQQSKGMQGCRPNPWPLPRELRAVS
jgi:hypothetical protein